MSNTKAAKVFLFDFYLIKKIEESYFTRISARAVSLRV